jgi:hypothetical protein
MSNIRLKQSYPINTIKKVSEFPKFSVLLATIIYKSMALRLQWKVYQSFLLTIFPFHLVVQVYHVERSYAFCSRRLINQLGANLKVAFSNLFALPGPLPACTFLPLESLVLSIAGRLEKHHKLHFQNNNMDSLTAVLT